MRDWNDDDNQLLAKAEHFLKMGHLMLGTIDLWTTNIGEEVDPDDLDDELKSRVSHVMWKVSMLTQIIDEDGPSQAFANVAHWVEKMNPNGVRIKEINSPEEFERLVDETIRETNGNGKEGKTSGGYL